MKKLLITLLLLSVIPAIGMDRAHFLELNQKAAELRKQKDWAGLLKVMVEIGHEMPGATPRYFLRIASVEMHLGHTAEAVKWMDKYAAMGLTYDVLTDDDLAPLAKEPMFKAVAARMRENIQPVSKAELVCTLPLPDMMPEDLTFERVSKQFVMSSIQHHTLYRVSLPQAGNQECAVAEIPLPEDAKHWPVLAVSSDATRKVLWMTASAMSGFPKVDDGRAALLAIDGESGKVLRRLDPATGSAAVLGDMSVAPDGTVYVTDSIGGGVYRVRGDLAAGKLEKIAEGLFSPQTPVAARDGKRLFVPDYPMGIAVVNLTGDVAQKSEAAQKSQVEEQAKGRFIRAVQISTVEEQAFRPASMPVKSPGFSPGDKANIQAGTKLEYLRHPPDVAVTGLDGLYLSGDSLIGIQNGTQPARIIRYRLNHAQTEILSAEIIEQSTERLGEPTHVVEADGWFYITANVGWNKIDDHGTLKSGQHFTKPILLRFRSK
jgi:sugar lactone lactonase YvrE